MVQQLSQPIVYVTRDIERALGLPLSTSGYYIISNKTTLSKKYADLENVLLIDESEQLSTWKLLEHPEAAAFIKENNNPDVLVFKNTKKIERICAEHSWNLLNPSAQLADSIEAKISQADLLEPIADLLPRLDDQPLTTEMQQVSWKGEPFILQYNHAHTGSGTLLISSEAQLKKLAKTFPEREVRLSRFVEGPIVTINCVATKNATLIGNPSYQITGLSPFTDNDFATVGNDFSLGNSLLSGDPQDQFTSLVTRVGDILREHGWRGLFGIDIVLDEEKNKLYIIEINARQPASTTFESNLQKNNTSFEAHILALQNTEPTNLQQISSGAQIVVRNTPKAPELSSEKLQGLTELGVIYQQYQDPQPGAELLRIQTTASLLEKHNSPTQLLESITSILWN